MAKFKILGVFIGPVETLSNGQKSGIIKRPVEELIVRRQGIEGDGIANLKHHGGDMRVVHHYSLKNYDVLKRTFPDISDRFVPGSFGENIVTAELSEDELNIGDVYRLGSAKVQLTVSRRPCATINAGYGDHRIFKDVLASGHTGWFYRVLEEGVVRAGDELEFLDRPFPDLPVARLYAQGYGPSAFSDKEFLRACLATGLMDKGWKPKLEAALASV